MTIHDRNGKEAFRGTAGADGLLQVPLIQSTIRPTEWNPLGFKLLVIWKERHIEEVFSPYTVTVETESATLSREVDMTKRQRLEMLAR